MSDHLDFDKIVQEFRGTYVCYINYNLLHELLIFI